MAACYFCMLRLTVLIFSWLSIFGQLGAVCNVVGVFVLMIVIPLVAKEKATPNFVFTHFNADNGAGIERKLYIFAIGLLMSHYTLAGYDASIHLVCSVMANWLVSLSLVLVCSPV